MAALPIGVRSQTFKDPQVGSAGLTGLGGRGPPTGHLHRASGQVARHTQNSSPERVLCIWTTRGVTLWLLAPSHPFCHFPRGLACPPHGPFQLQKQQLDTAQLSPKPWTQDPGPGPAPRCPLWKTPLLLQWGPWPLPETGGKWDEIQPDNTQVRQLRPPEGLPLHPTFLRWLLPPLPAHPTDHPHRGPLCPTPPSQGLAPVFCSLSSFCSSRPWPHWVLGVCLSAMLDHCHHGPITAPLRCSSPPTGCSRGPGPPI